MIRRYYAATLGLPDIILDLPSCAYNGTTGVINVTCTLSRSISVNLTANVKVDYTPAGGSPTTTTINVTITAGSTSANGSYTVAGTPIQVNFTRVGILSYTPLKDNGVSIVNRRPY